MSGPSTRVPTALVFLRAYLNRDRLWASSLHCFLSVFSMLQSDFPLHPQSWHSKRLEEPNMTELTSALGGLKVTQSVDSHAWLHDDEEILDKDLKVPDGRYLYERIVWPIKKKLNSLLQLVVLTGRMWMTLLNLLLIKMKENRAATSFLPSSLPANNMPPPPIITVDETLLIFGFQDKIVQVAVALCQLTTTNVLNKNTRGANSRWPETIRTLLQPQEIVPELLDGIIPQAAVTRRFCTDAIHCIGGLCILPIDFSAGVVFRSGV